MFRICFVILLLFERQGQGLVSQTRNSRRQRQCGYGCGPRRSRLDDGKEEEEEQQRYPTIQELMKATEDKLKSRQRETHLGLYEPPRLETPKIPLYATEEEKTYEYLEWLEILAGRRPQAGGDDTFTVAVVLGKALSSGRVSVEHAARVCGLVRALRDGLSPSMVIFASSAASKGDISPQATSNHNNKRSASSLDDAHAACTYFHHVCESVLGAPFPASRVVVSSTPLTTKESMRRLLSGPIGQRLRSESDPIHVALFASEYQLQRLDKIYRVTPRLSMLTPLALRNATVVPSKKKKKASSFASDSSAERAYATTWSFRSVPYPPQALSDEAATFLSKIHVVLDSLVPLLVNLHGVVNKEEFLAREYYDDLCDAKVRLERARAVVDSPMRPAALRSLRTMASLSPSKLNAADAQPLLDETLERVVRWLGDLERILRPAALRTDSLTSEDWRKALKLLQRALHDARAASDPDIPLPASMWGHLIEDERHPPKKSTRSRPSTNNKIDGDKNRQPTNATHLYAPSTSPEKNERDTDLDDNPSLPPGAGGEPARYWGDAASSIQGGDPSSSL